MNAIASLLNQAFFLSSNLPLWPAFYSPFYNPLSQTEETAGLENVAFSMP